MSNIQTSSVSSERRVAVDATLQEVRAILKNNPVSRESLKFITARLEALAQKTHLFLPADFPAPVAEETTETATRYHLNPADADDDIALYLNAINPGKTTFPHNHTTWATIVALKGHELNRIYERTDDKTDPEFASLTLLEEVTIQPGTSIAFLPEDIHSIHVTGQESTLHFHLYGKPLETLTQRVGIHPETGRIINFNASQMAPSKVVP